MKTNYLNQSTSTGNGLYGSFVNNSKVSATDGLPLRYRCADDNKELLSFRYPCVIPIVKALSRIAAALTLLLTLGTVEMRG